MYRIYYQLHSKYFDVDNYPQSNLYDSGFLEHETLEGLKSLIENTANSTNSPFIYLKKEEYEDVENEGPYIKFDPNILEISKLNNFNYRNDYMFQKRKNALIEKYRIKQLKEQKQEQLKRQKEIRQLELQLLQLKHQQSEQESQHTVSPLDNLSFGSIEIMMQINEQTQYLTLENIDRELEKPDDLDKKIWYTCEYSFNVKTQNINIIELLKPRYSTIIPESKYNKQELEDNLKNDIIQNEKINANYDIYLDEHLNKNCGTIQNFKYTGFKFGRFTDYKQ